MASLLPNGEQTFLDNNGNPLSGGTVGFYIPTTMTLKAVWSDPSMDTPLTNPVTLDGAGRAIIYGIGTYRQIVRDSLSNLIWDQLTGSPGGGINANTTRVVTAAGPVTVGVNDGAILLNKSVPAATVVNLGTAVTRDGNPITIKDFAQNSDTYNISLVPSGAELIDGQALWTLASIGGWVTLWPLPDNSGWWVGP